MSKKVRVFTGYGFVVSDYNDSQEVERLLESGSMESFESQYGVEIVFHDQEWGCAIFSASAYHKAVWGEDSNEVVPLPCDFQKWPQDEERLRLAARELGISCVNPRFIMVCSY